MNTPSQDEVNAKLAATESRHEARLTSIEAKVDVNSAETRGKVDSQYVELIANMDRRFAELKAEIHKANDATIKWMAGIIISSVLLGAAVMTFVLNNAVPKAAPAAAPPAIIVYPAAPSLQAGAAW